jgi:hypothetical protein
MNSGDLSFSYGDADAFSRRSNQLWYVLNTNHLSFGSNHERKGSYWEPQQKLPKTTTVSFWTKDLSISATKTS